MAGAADEFGLIEQAFAPLAANFAGALSLTDDAALVDIEPGEQLVVTTDAVVAGVHVAADAPPEDMAIKALRVNLSDLAAMGAAPIGYLLALALPRPEPAAWARRFAAALADEQQLFNVSLIGGDTVVTDGPATAAITALGRCTAGLALRRSGAAAGDAVFVSGAIGDAALGLRVSQGDTLGLDAADRQALVERLRRPTPRLALGRALVEVATAAIDVSDGLVADLGHICRASGLGAEVDWPRVPLSGPAGRALEADPGLVEAVLAGGDDYELLFTALPEKRAAIAEIAGACAIPIVEIGRTLAGAGVAVRDDRGRKLDLTEAGYRHL